MTSIASNPIENAIKRKFFATPVQSALTIVFGIAILWLLWLLFDWAVIRAVFAADGRDRCLLENAGACWSVIANRWRLILFGIYEREEQWRSALACTIMVLVAVLSCMPFFWKARRISLLWVTAFAIFYGLMKGGIFGLSVISEQNWGGISLTVFVFASVCIIGMPLSIVLALLRRSDYPVVSRLTGLLIDLIRSLPLISIMFAFAIVLPFALPGWATGEKLYRVIIGYSLFFACYQAEIIRGGMQALPVGQREAGKALGLGYWHRIQHIILPQVFRSTLPSTINQFVITFKETTLVVIIGFFDVMASGNAAFGTSEWSFAHVEVYAFVAMIFFVFVFSLSRYGAHLESRLKNASR